MNGLKQAGIGLAVLLGATFSASAASEHDNEVFFAIAGIQNFTFTQTGYNITSGQPYSGASGGVTNAGEMAQITVKAGRKGSSGVATWFQQQVGAGQTLVCDSKGTFPSSLNFAVEGTLVMQVGGKTVTCDNIIVAQGNFGTTNNWWMGGPNMKGIHISLSGATIQKCSVQGSLLPAAVIFTPQTPCVNNFSISVNPL